MPRNFRRKKDFAYFISLEWWCTVRNNSTYTKILTFYFTVEAKIRAFHLHFVHLDYILFTTNPTIHPANWLCYCSHCLYFISISVYEILPRILANLWWSSDFSSGLRHQNETLFSVSLTITAVSTDLWCTVDTIVKRIPWALFILRRFCSSIAMISRYAFRAVFLFAIFPKGISPSKFRMVEFV